MAYLDPLAYLLGLEGLALLRAYGGDFDREFVAARVAESRRLLDHPELVDAAVEVTLADTVAGYREWSRTYDDPGNGLFELDLPIVQSMLEGVPAGAALDAACGTGRFSEYLAGAGHRVTGVDISPDMLSRARQRVPQATFVEGDLLGLPVGDDEVDIVVCALALTHVPKLGPVLGEFARVLRPGGHLVIADVHHSLVNLGSVPKMDGPAGERLLMPAYRHLASDYLGAALPLGFVVRRCEEPRFEPADVDQPTPDEFTFGPWSSWPWSLMHNVPAATGAAFGGSPILVVWHFQLG